MYPRPTIPEVRPLVKAIYEKSCVGCCLHIVLDDGNTKNSDVDFCIQEAQRNNHGDCLLLATKLRLMSRTQRAKLYRDRFKK